MARGTAEKGIGLVQWFLSLAATVSFVAGYSISIIGGIWWPANPGIILTLIVMGLMVGLFNITGKEVVPYLVAAIALVLVGRIEAFEPLNLVVKGLGDKVNDVVGMMATFTAPAAVIQAVRAGIVLSRPGD